tara:strand:- start:174 stop:536 length:363 start_codon:yes stop_codon:yes gene_type:complete
MFRSTLLFTLLLSLPLAVGCTSDSASKDESAAKTEAAQAESDKTEAPQAAEAKVYDVACGCSIEAVGHCGEYAIVDGRHVEIKDHGLGSMPFCGKSGQKAKIAGEVKGDELHATSVEVLK